MVETNTTSTTSPETAISAATASEEVLQHFWDLATVDEATRLKAAASLVQELAKSQQEYGGNRKGKKDAARQRASKEADVDAMLHHCSPLVVYSLRRLVKGLASGRQAARQGFALALTLLLGEIQAVPTEAVLGLMDIWLQANNSMKGSDVRDALLGRPFGFSAVIRSGRLSADQGLSLRLGNLLLELMQSKSFLKEASAVVLLELLEASEDSAFLTALEEVRGLKAVLQTPAESATPEDLLLALQLWGRLPAATLAGCSLLPQNVTPPPPGFFSARQRKLPEHPTAAAAAFFSSDHLLALLEPLRGASASHPRMHSLWKALLSLLIPGYQHSLGPGLEAMAGNGGKIPPGLLETFWTLFVEEELFSSTHERKFLGFQVFTALLPHLGPEQVPIVFSPKFQRSLVNSLAQSDRHLHAAAKKATQQMKEIAAASQDPALRVAIAVSLQRQGGIGFDKLTQTSTAAQLLKEMDAGSIQLYVDHLKAAFRIPEDSGEAQAVENQEVEEDGGIGKAPPSAAEAARRWAVEQLAGICALPQAPVQTQKAAVHFLALHAFFELDAEEVQGKELKAAAGIEPPPSESLRKLCAARLITVLEKAGKAKPQCKGERDAGGKMTQQQQAEQQTHERRGENELLKEAVSFIGKTEAAKGARLAIELSEPIRGAVEALRKLEARAAKALAKADEEVSRHGSKSDQLLSVLHLARWLYLYVIGDAENVDADLVDELSGIFKAAFGKAGGEASEDEVTWMDQVVDVCLSLLAYSSAELPSGALRDAVEGFFRGFAAQLTPTGMQDLVRVLTHPDRPAKGDADDEVLAPEEDSEDDESATDGSDDDEASDDGSATDEDPDAGAEGESSMDIDPQNVSSLPEVDLDEDMSDEQMFKMDKMIAAILRLNKDEKSSAKRTQQAMLNFKLRTLALLEMFAKAAPGSPLLAAHLPLLVKSTEAAEKAVGTKHLAERFRAVICKLCRSRPSEEAARSISPDIFRAAIVDVHLSRGRASIKNPHLKAASEAALQYLFSAATLAGTEDHKGAAAEGVRAVLSSFFKRRNLRIPRVLLEQLARQNPELAAALLGDLADFSTAVRTSLFPEAVGMLDVILSKAQKNTGTEAAAGIVPKLAASTIAVLEGKGFERAKKHGEVLKTLADVWDRLSKLLPEPLTQLLPAELLQTLKRACADAHASAVTPKISQAAAKIGSPLGLSLGSFNPDGLKRTYQKPEAAVPQFPGLGGEADASEEGEPASSGALESGKKKAGKKRKSEERSQKSSAAEDSEKASRGGEASVLAQEVEVEAGSTPAESKEGKKARKGSAEGLKKHSEQASSEAAAAKPKASVAGRGKGASKTKKRTSA